MLESPLNISNEDRDALGNTMAELESAAITRIVSTSRKRAETSPSADISLELEVEPPQPYRVLRAAYRQLRTGGYPPPFQLCTFWIEDGALHWGPPLPGFVLATFYGLSPANRDLAPDIHEVAAQHHGRAVRAYRLIELAHDIRWLASSTFSSRTADRMKDFMPTNPTDAAQLLVIRASEFTAAATEWIAQLKIEKMRSELPLAVINARRSEAASTWRLPVRKRFDELMDMAPNATVSSVAEIITKELREWSDRVEVSDRTIYQYLWEVSRQRHKG